MSGMGRFEHGGDIYAHEGVLDFSANVNPLGMPPAAVRALRESVSEFSSYPDPSCRALTDALCAAEGVASGQLVCTAGASDLIARVCAVVRPKKALVCAPCYSGYEQALEQTGAQVVRHLLREEDGFALTGSVAADIVPGVGLVFIASPNNPTGLLVDREVLAAVLQAARAAGARVVLDECFLDFTYGKSALDLATRFPELVVMRAFTKTYAMAGLRLGYGICADERFVGRLRAAGQPWAVSTPAQVAGVAALQDDGFLERTRRYVADERRFLMCALEDAGMRVVEGVANYLLFSSPVELYAPLLEQGIMIRRCDNYQGLSGRWYRMAVRTHGENERFAQALSHVVETMQGEEHR